MAEDLERGVWRGEYVDANGYRGDLTLALEPSGGRVAGNAELRIRTEDEPQVIRGEIEGDIEDDVEDDVEGVAATADRPDRGRRRRKRLRLRLKIDGAPGQEFRYDAKIRPAGSHARQALFGVVHEAPRTNFGGGVWFAWRFDGPQDDLR